MAMITRMLTGLLTRSAWLLGPDRVEWIEGLVAEASETRAGRARVAWLLGGVWVIAGKLLRRNAIRVSMFIAAAGIVLWVVWPGGSSDHAVGVNRVEIPLYLWLLALVPPLVRRFFGSVRRGLLPRTVRVVGYLVVLALLTGKAVEAREGQKLGAYFGGSGPFRVVMFLVIAGYTAMLLILTSHRVRLTRSALPIAIGPGTLTGVALYARYGYHLQVPPQTSWVFLALPLTITGFAVTRRAARDTPANGMTAARQGGLVAVCATGTAVLLLAALTTVTISLAPQRVPLQTPPPPPNGGCETCDPNSLVIPPDLRHEYWAGLSITQENLPFYAALIAAPIFALFPAGLGAGLAEVSLRARNRFDSPRSAGPPAPSQTQG
jgi:hypothetical protein